MDAEAEGIRNVGLGYIHLYLKAPEVRQDPGRCGAQDCSDLRRQHRR